MEYVSSAVFSWSEVRHRMSRLQGTHALYELRESLRAAPADAADAILRFATEHAPHTLTGEHTIALMLLFVRAANPRTLGFDEDILHAPGVSWRVVVDRRVDSDDAVVALLANVPLIRHVNLMGDMDRFPPPGFTSSSADSSRPVEPRSSSPIEVAGFLIRNSALEEVLNSNLRDLLRVEQVSDTVDFASAHSGVMESVAAASRVEYELAGATLPWQWGPSERAPGMGLLAAAIIHIDRVPGSTAGDLLDAINAHRASSALIAATVRPAGGQHAVIAFRAYTGDQLRHAEADPYGLPILVNEELCRTEEQRSILRSLTNRPIWRTIPGSRSTTVDSQNGGSKAQSNLQTRRARPKRRLQLNRNSEEINDVAHDEHLQRTNPIDQRLARRRRGASLQWFVDPDGD